MVPSGQSVPPSGVVPAGQGGDPDTQNGGYCDGDWCYEYDNGDGSSYYGDDTDYSDNSGFSENGDSGWSNDGWYYYPNDFYLDSRLNSLQQYGSSGSTKLKIRARARR